MGRGGGKKGRGVRTFVSILFLLPLISATTRSAALGKMATIFMYGQVRLNVVDSILMA
jgi:hypothetical protein